MAHPLVESCEMCGAEALQHGYDDYYKIQTFLKKSDFHACRKRIERG